MARTVAIGIQDFDKFIEGKYFYIDKTSFIKEWWESGDDVTLITRPRRFGKTLNMSMLDYFFSVNHADKGSLFEGLEIWNDEKYRELQGTYPVIYLSFANIKERNYKSIRKTMCQLIAKLYHKNDFLLESGLLGELDKRYFRRVSEEMDDSDAALSLYQLSDFLYRYYGKKVIILLDEYDTPMQEAYINGFWDELAAFTRSLFNSTFKTNPYLERGIMTGITRVSKESIFSDLNNLEVVTTTSDKYATAFGFAEEEVFAALDECGYGEEKEKVKRWYDGFTFGKHTDIYNPWSIINFIDKGKYDVYWANSSSNGLVNKLVRESGYRTKETFENLIEGQCIYTPIDEQVVYNYLDNNESAIWSLLLASGYLKVISYERQELIGDEEAKYELQITNNEVRIMFLEMIRGWFNGAKAEYNDFIKSLLAGRLKEMNAYMNNVALRTFSYFDTGKGPCGAEPEKFYHGFVLGLIVELRRDYVITSNRESGYGRYDIVIEPKNPDEHDAIIIEFKVHDEDDEASLRDTVQAALAQIEEKKYAENLVERGIARDRIRSYGFAFEGKKVLIGQGL